MKNTVISDRILRGSSSSYWSPEVQNKTKEKMGEIFWTNDAFRYLFDVSKACETPEVSNPMNEFFEKALALFLLVIFSPIMLGVAIAIRYSSPGSIFYKQVRVGRDGETFKILKFRTMIVDAEKNTGHTLSWEGDPRITPLGNFLRKSHLDELPQLINVLTGDMSFIGPRPERPEFTNKYDQEIENYSNRHAVKPGITGLAQIALLYDANAAQKLKFDLLYITYKDSIMLNLLIALYTAKKMVFLKPKANLAV